MVEFILGVLGFFIGLLICGILLSVQVYRRAKLYGISPSDYNDLDLLLVTVAEKVKRGE